MLAGDSSSSVLGSSADAVASVATTSAHDVSAAAAAEVGGGLGGSTSGEDDKGRGDELSDRSFGGNRWPRQETLALLKIRSDMDVAFKDASVKGPLWEDVSRKLADLGYNRSAKKCKEKFENVYKYHKRTKEGRTGKPDGKNYRFFDQLEAFEHHPQIQSPTPPKPPTLTSTLAMPLPNLPSIAHQVTVTSATLHTANVSQGQANIVTQPVINATTIPSLPPTNPTNTIFPPPPIPQPIAAAAATTTNPSQPTIPSLQNISADLISNSTDSSSTSSDEQLEDRRKKKRKWKDFFERLMKEVIEKQEELQKRFLDAIEKRERDRMVREEAWRAQEMTRINREREILAQERSIAAAKDAAVMAFLQKISEQQNPGQQPHNNLPPPQPTATQPQPQPQPAPLPLPQPVAPAPSTAAPHAIVTTLEIHKNDNGGNFTPTSSSRWPKVEVQALIKLRTSLDAKYQENGPKGPLWEEISLAMRKLGYNRSSKRCKEKWENINKYFKKVKESNKKRPEDAKTCPYFHQLDALYREKNRYEISPSSQVKPENSNMVPLMVRPEQQWPPQQSDAVMEDVESEPMDQNQEEEDDDDDKDGDDEEEDEGGGHYEIVASKPSSMGAAS
ncbi:hypothetical protein ACJW31_01G114400 [Castanea mollissima]